MRKREWIVDENELLLVTGANGFIGARAVHTLLYYGFKRIRCFVRPSSNLRALDAVISPCGKNGVEMFEGNLLTPKDCERSTEGVSVIYHLAAGKGEKSYPSAFMNSVVTTRNLLEASRKIGTLRRFVNVSSFTVYSNKKIRSGGLLDEMCEVEAQPETRGEAYTYAKVKQDELVAQYMRKYDIPCVFVRPGAVYGPGDPAISGRIGIDTFGFFLHLGGSNLIPLTYVDNCAEAIVLAGLKKNANREIFNVVDDNLPSSKQFLRMYKKNVKDFRSIYVPKTISYLLCFFWEKYSDWSKGQLPPVFNRKRWSTDWKGNRYSNQKIKKLLGWYPKVSFDEATRRYFEYCRNEVNKHA